ncbi:LysM peptidoglycan-binding domain-containing protein [Lacticaseibacillus thailandensis]|uniref:LysM peptidoglycan-binding domain-containing protein n=1 Tax=Lacticaseibacillus thailandensis TaxID=381741 RepID=UPI0006CFE281|nr:LysM domain-containing protein [Lacticaseibacillus thailandensis]
MTKSHSVKKNLLSVATLSALGLTAFGAANVGKTEHVSAATDKTYTVKSGDTLGQIAASQHTTVKKLADANKIANPNFILTGQSLQLASAATTVTDTAAKGTYTVKAGDTLSAIARANGVSVAQLVAANHISNPNFILVGQQLQLAATSTAASSASSATSSAASSATSVAPSSAASAVTSSAAPSSATPSSATTNDVVASSATASSAAASSAAAGSAAASVAAASSAAASSAAASQLLRRRHLLLPLAAPLLPR